MNHLLKLISEVKLEKQIYLFIFHNNNKIIVALKLFTTRNVRLYKNSISFRCSFIHCYSATENFVWIHIHCLSAFDGLEKISYNMFSLNLVRVSLSKRFLRLKKERTYDSDILFVILPFEFLFCMILLFVLYCKFTLLYMFECVYFYEGKLGERTVRACSTILHIPCRRR